MQFRRNNLKERTEKFLENWQDVACKEEQEKALLNDFFQIFELDLKDTISKNKIPMKKDRWGNFDLLWFSSIVQDLMDQTKRRELGAHYTSEENILKLIKPLFLDDLRKEFEQIKYNKRKLKEFHNKLAALRFLDPACGCGNFLMVAYRELRRLELDVLTMLIDDSDQISYAVQKYCRVNVNQFYGIEIEDFPCQVAQVGMWLTDHKMNRRVSVRFGLDYVRLPLRASATIVNANALRIDWNSVVPKEKLNYIMGNPPFVGYHLRNQEQQTDMDLVFGENFKKHGVLDYVAAWYKKAADYMKNTKIESAFVSTNSISQGQQPAILWEPLMKEDNTIINFAHRTFKWNNEAKGKKAGVHCVIIGFSDYLNNETRKIYDSKGNNQLASNINPYLVDAPNVLVARREYPICDVSKMVYGNKAVDGGFLILNYIEKEDIVKNKSISRKWIRPFVGAKEFLNNEKRWCLWLVDAKPNELKKCRPVMERIKKVKEFRLKSKKYSTRELSKYPTVFSEIRQPETNYIVLPEISTGTRQYIPIGFLKHSIIPSNKLQLIPNATLYEFGVINSIVHMAWMRAVCGRFGTGYIYSSSIVYNNFIWPTPTPAQKAKIEQCAKAVLDARKLYPDSTLADLYDPTTMPAELLKAHENLDKSVKAAYGKGFETEEEIVTSLMKLYKEAIDAEKAEADQKTVI